MITEYALYAEYNLELIPFLWNSIISIQLTETVAPVVPVVKKQKQAVTYSIIDSGSATNAMDNAMDSVSSVDESVDSDNTEIVETEPVATVPTLMPKPLRPDIKPESKIEIIMVTGKVTPEEHNTDVKTTSAKVTTTVLDVPLKDLIIDPKRFQFKRMANEHGCVGSLSGVRIFDPNLAGVLLCWQESNIIYVVNGHNRVHLANQLGVKTLPIKLIAAKDHAEARFVGALANIAEKSCDVYDVAKFFRDNSLSASELTDRGICLKGNTVKEALAIVKLNDLLFEKFLLGDIPPEIAIAIGEAELNTDQQNTVWQSIKKCLDQNKELTKSLVSDYIDAVLICEEYQQSDLFGNNWSQSCIYEYASIVNSVCRNIKKNVKIFGMAAKNATSLKHADNHINTEKSIEVSQANQAIYNWFKRESKFVGDVSQYINSHAMKLATGEPVDIDAIALYISSIFRQSPAIV